MNFNVNDIGTYKINYEVYDSSGNMFNKTITVLVKDITKPVIEQLEELVFNVNQEVDLNDYFNIYDNYDSYNDLTINYQQNNVNYNEIGTYKLTIVVKDKSGNDIKKEFNVIIFDLQ